VEQLAVAVWRAASTSAEEFRAALVGDWSPVATNVDGVVELARTGDVLHVARPAIGEAHATVTVFKLAGGEARRVTVKFGRAAVKDIEIASGLNEGDQIVLSDMSRWDGHDRLRME